MDVLKNKSYLSIDYISRYSPFPYYYHSTDDRYIMATDLWLDDSTAYKAYIVKRGDTFDNLALKFYNNPTYYWIICSYNHITDPYTELKEGTLLKIPSLANIKFKK